MATENRARALFVERDIYITKADLTDFDCVVAKVGESFCSNVQAASDAGVPIILFYEQNVDLYLLSPIQDESRWAGEFDDEQIKEMDKYIYVGNPLLKVKRSIHGIMLDCSQTKTANGDTLTGNWVATAGNHVVNLIYKHFGLPVYMYFKPIPAIESIWSIDNDVQAVRLFIDKNAGGISTVDFNKALTSDKRYPVAGTRPKLAYDGGKPWYWWLFKSNPLTFLYMSNKSDLYKELEFTPKTVTVVTPPITTPEISPVVTPTTPSTTTPILSSDIKTLNDNLVEIKNLLTILVNKLNHILQ